MPEKVERPVPDALMLFLITIVVPTSAAGGKVWRKDHYLVAAQSAMKALEELGDRNRPCGSAVRVIEMIGRPLDVLPERTRCWQVAPFGRETPFETT